MPKFKFTLSAALDKYRDDKARSERALEYAQAEHDRQLQLQREMQAEADRLKQRAEEVHDNLCGGGSGWTGIDLHGEGRYLEALKIKHKQQLEKVEQQKQEVHAAKQKVNLQEKVVQEDTAKVEALERLEQKQYEQWRRQRQKKEDLQREEDAIQIWNRQQRVS